LIIFNAAFVEQNRHGMMYGDDINVGECLFDTGAWYFKCGMQMFDRGDVGGGPCLGCEDYYRSDLPSMGLDDIYEGLIFSSFEGDCI
jgi:hypothetical protein